MSFLEQSYFGNTLMGWFVAIGFVILTIFVLSIAKSVIVRKLRRIVSATETQVDDLIVDMLEKTRFFFLLAIALYGGTFLLTLSITAVKIVQTIAALALLLQGALWGTEIISYLIDRSIKQRLTQDAASATTLTALRFLSKLILWSVVLLLALDNIGIDITALIAGLGVGGIAVALAIQNILGDLFASLSIVLDKPFVIGDFIIVNEYLGTVEHIGLKTTRIRSLSGEQVIFSNADLLSSRIRNFKRMYERRIVFEIGVTYQTPLEKLKWISDTLKDIVEKEPMARFDRAHFKMYGDSALIYEVVYFVKKPDFNVYMDTQQAINIEIFRRFQAAGIDFAYKTQTLFVKQEPAAPLQAES